jgi:5-methylcytosine-specific restriction protein A
MATLLKVLNNLADIKSAGGVALRVRTQDRALIRKKREAVLRETGRLACEACDFDFMTRTESIAVGLSPPVHALAPGSRTRMQDLAVVRANCHA